MKNFVFAFTILCSSNLVAQFIYNANGYGIQTPYTTASGYDAFATGYNSTASGSKATAMGYATTASGNSSTATGAGTTASGDRSTAMGSATTAEDYMSFAIGTHNKTDETPNPDTFSFQNMAFVIGNGGYDIYGNYDGHLSNALEVLFDGTTTIAGNVTATAFIGDGSQLTNMPVNFNANGGGIHSFNSTASGYTSTAMGSGATASGDYSTAMGAVTTAIGEASTAMGAGATASGDRSTAMGVNTEASGQTSTAMGSNTTASGSISTAIGFGTTASGQNSTAMGMNTRAFGNFATAMGSETVASGDHSIAMGVHTNAQDFASIAIGTFNKIDETPNPTKFSYQNTAFVIGNGGYDYEGNYLGNRSNAFEVLFDGTTTIAGDLNINSDARLKANIISLGATLSKLLQIDGKTYTMKKDANHKKKIGLLAQDIEKVFPELVTETNDIKSVNYQGLVPVLINAMKEQQDEINSYKNELNNQRKEIDTYKKELDELKAMVKQLANR